jgi:hypothetical protein
MGGISSRAGRLDDEHGFAKLAWKDPRILPWNIVGVVGVTATPPCLGVIGFLVIDRLGLAAEHSQQSIAWC